MNRSFIFGIIIFSIVAVGGSYLLLGGNKQKTTTDLPKVYSASDKERPRVEIKELIKDMGKIKVSDQKSELFSIKNIGNKPLTLSNISSSCGCTVGQVIIAKKESEEFGMHSQSDTIFSVDPNEIAKLKVTYRPYVMPVSGPVEREVYITTNDPDNPKLVFKIKANVK